MQDVKLDLKQLVEDAVKARGVSGIMELVELSGMAHQKVRKVWSGDKTTKLCHVEDVLNSLGYKLKAVPQND